jgi:tRNA-modifying protein YgfZ
VRALLRSSGSGRSYNRSVIATSEYELLTESVGLVDRSARGKLLLEGSEAVDFLQGQVTNDIEALESGKGCYAALLDHKGKLRSDMRVLRGDGWVWMDTEPLGLAALKKTCQMYSLGRDVRFEDVTADRAILSLIGPAARERLEVVPPVGEHGFVEGEHGLHVSTDLGVDVICPAAAVQEVREALALEPASEETADCLRIESGRPRYGLDMDGQTIPEEAGLNERAVSFTKGCYIGQETVARLHYKGRPNRRLRGLRLSTPAVPGDDVLLGGKRVGSVGSTCVSPVLGPIALGVIRREASPGDTVLVGEAAAPAELVELPFERP